MPINSEQYDNVNQENDKYEIINEKETVFAANLTKRQDLRYDSFDSIRNEKIQRQQLIRHTFINKDGKKSNEIYF